MPTFLLLLVVLVSRVIGTVARGIRAVVLLPARTALAIAPHTTRPRWLLVGGVTLSTLAAALLAIAVARATR